jgi:hypothetical protein
MNKSRKEKLAQLIQEAELQKFAQEAIENTEAPPTDPQYGEQVADAIFDKILANIVGEIDSIE